MKITLALVAAATVCVFGSADATNYYLSPNGDDTHPGTSTTSAWASLGHAASFGLSPGDTLFIMGGVYTTAQNFKVEWQNPTKNTGAAGAPLVFKAYGDGVAEFRALGPVSDEENALFAFFNEAGWTGVRSYITIDGFGKLNGLPYQILIKQLGSTYSSYAISFISHTVNYQYEHITIRGIEVDGSNPGVYYMNGISLGNCRYFDIDNCYIHDTSPSTGPIAPGNNTDRTQGSGEGMLLKSCTLGKVRNCTFRRSNHALLEIEMSTQYTGYICGYIQILNNVFDNHYGAGLEMPRNTHHCLIDGNIFIHSGETTTFPKAAIQISGWSNSIRRNVFFNPVNQALSIEAHASYDWLEDYISNNNLVYNNTFFHNEGRDMTLLVNNNASNHHGDTASVENNGFYNNIFYKANGPYSPEGGGNFWSEIVFDLYNANDAHNWLSPDQSSSTPASTAWGGNKFRNNLIRVNNRGFSADSLVIFAKDGTYGGGWWSYGIPNLEADGTGAWGGNIGTDPQMFSEDPEAYGPTNGWWHLQGTSPCVDHGVVVNDVNGAYVEATFPGYGWGNLSYVGSAPDIGAFEYGGQNPSPPVAPVLSSRPGRK